MKITHISGSPRKQSNSRNIGEQFTARAAEKGGEVSTHILNKMDIKGCQGCYACKKGKDRCIVKDDLAPVLDEIYETDILVISTPVYFWDLPGQLKCLIDRFYSYAKEDWQTNPEPSRLPTGKKVVFIQTQGAGEGLHDEIFGKYDAIFKMFAGFEACYPIRGFEVSGYNSVEDLPELNNTAIALADKLIA